MSEIRDLVAATAHRVFSSDPTAIQAEIARSGLESIQHDGDLGDVITVIKIAAYHAAADDLADRVMPQFGDARLRGALIRAAQISGALQRVQEMTYRYAAERKQFGRALVDFQAIQQQLAELAGEALLATTCVDRAGVDPSAMNIGVAKAVAGAAAGRVAAIAHQVHGAIGLTHEYALHTLTTRLWQWRDDAGTEAEWHEVLGEAVLQEDDLWVLVADG